MALLDLDEAEYSASELLSKESSLWQAEYKNIHLFARR